MPPATPVRVAVIDVGSNTTRLVVAEKTPTGIAAVASVKADIALGSEIVHHGRVRRAGLTKLAEEVKRMSGFADELNVEALDIFVSAPARQARNGEELVETLMLATGRDVRALSAAEEGILAFEGATASKPLIRGPLAVCDVGGGSTQITAGDRRNGVSCVAWTASLDVGSLRLTAATLITDPPAAGEVAAAQAHVAALLEPLQVPAAASVLAVGGSARAVARLVREALTEASLDRALRVVVAQPSGQLAQMTGLSPARARSLAGGVIVLQALHRRFGSPLIVAFGGVREGAIARLIGAR